MTKDDGTFSLNNCSPPGMNLQREEEGPQHKMFPMTRLHSLGLKTNCTFLSIMKNLQFTIAYLPIAKFTLFTSSVKAFFYNKLHFVP